MKFLCRIDREQQAGEFLDPPNRAWAKFALPKMVYTSRGFDEHPPREKMLRQQPSQGGLSGFPPVSGFAKSVRLPGHQRR
jgi:hypothetical protein